MNWGELYAHIATATGWSFRQIDDMTIPEISDLLDYWRGSPPVHVLAKAWLGFKPGGGDSASSPPPPEDAEAAQFINTVAASEFDRLTASLGLPLH